MTVAPFGNAQWQPALKTFDGVEMVLVPAGCLRQGSPCFEQPFWIDRYEVSNAQFQSNGGRTSFNRASWNNGSDHPREYIYWSEAQAYCQQRGGRLPTGAEWEYAARGPDNLEYPWGNSFVANNAVYSENARGTTAPVGSRPGGASWVGAEDMSGNVWEWVDETAQNGSKANHGGSFDYWRDQQTTTASKANADSTANFNIGLRCMRDFNPDDLA
jgi:formylglycine-generating enzyme required for sulfatase activity